MTHSALARQVLDLPHDAREAFLADLIANLDAEAASAEPPLGEWEAEWSAAVLARAADLDAGRVTSIPADRVLAAMRAGVVPAPR